MTYDPGHDFTAERLCELLSYDPTTGVLTWKVTRGKARIGAVAGTPMKGGHLLVGLDCQSYLAHRLVWFYVYGEFPQGALDHINGDPADNRITNLRLATKSQNAINSRRRRDNTSGFKGVSYYRAGRKWHAYITADGVRRHLGYFSSAEKAHAAFVAAAAELHGEFARVA